MAIRQLVNEANSTGLVNGILTSLTDAVTIQIVDGLQLLKTADKSSWSGGALTYTVRVINNSGLPYENLQIFDNIDISTASLVPDSVTYNDNVVSYEYNAFSGALHIIPAPQLDLPDGGVASFSFQITKVEP